MRRAAAAFVTELSGQLDSRFRSRREFARAMGYHPSYISHIMAGRSNPTRTFARRADDVLGTGGVFEEHWRAYEAACGDLPRYAAHPPVPLAPPSTEFPRGDRDSTPFPGGATPDGYVCGGETKFSEKDPQELAGMIAEAAAGPQGTAFEKLLRDVSDLPAGTISRTAATLKFMGHERLSGDLISIAGNRWSSTEKFGELAGLLHREGLVSGEEEFDAMVRRRRTSIERILDPRTAFHALPPAEGRA